MMSNLNLQNLLKNKSIKAINLEEHQKSKHKYKILQNRKYIQNLKLQYKAETALDNTFRTLKKRYL